MCNSAFTLLFVLNQQSWDDYYGKHQSQASSNHVQRYGSFNNINIHFYFIAASAQMLTCHLLLN